MSRFLFAWELGANYGHLVRDLPVAERLRTAGHAVAFAVSDSRTAAELLAPRQFPFLQAPLTLRPPRLANPPGNYAELLLAENWGDRTSLLGRINAWHSLFALIRPDMIVADHAPTALLAARCHGVRSIAMGSGFEIPPSTSPLPSIRPWDETPESRLMQSEALILDCLNTLPGEKPLQRLVDLIPPCPILTTFAELDHYGARDDASYVGSIHGMGGSNMISWPERAGETHRILAYLRPDQRTTDTIIGLLATIKATTICVIPGASKAFVDKYARANLTIMPEPVHLRSLLAMADVLIGYGSSSVIAESLLACVPLLMIPQTVEQYLGATRVESLDAGIVVGQKRGRTEIEIALEKLLTDPSYRHAAEDFSVKYRLITPEHAADRATAMILAACRTQGCAHSANTAAQSGSRHFFTDTVPS